MVRGRGLRASQEPSVLTVNSPHPGVGERLQIAVSAHAWTIWWGPSTAHQVRVRVRVRLGGACGERDDRGWGSCQTGGRILPYVGRRLVSETHPRRAYVPNNSSS